MVETTEAAILASGVRSADDVRRHPRPLVEHSPRRRRLNLELRGFLLRKLYSNPVVFRAQQPGRDHAGRPVPLLPANTPAKSALSSQKRARRAGWHRAICDYLSGMTDRYAILDHQRLFGLKSDH